MENQVSLKAPVVLPAISVAEIAPRPVTVHVIDIPANIANQRIAEGKCPTCGKRVSKPGAEGQGDTCAGHVGKIRLTAMEATAVPIGWIGMSKICRALEAQGFSTKEIVDACGGDACTEPILDKVFQVVYVGRRKFLSPDVLVTGPDALRGKDKKVEAKKVEATMSLVEKIVATNGKSKK